MNKTLDLDLQIESTISNSPTAKLFRAWSEQALSINEAHTVTIRVVDEAEMTELNTTYRHKSGSTNVLSFPFETPVPLPEKLLGDVVICAPVIEREAKQQGKNIEAHWAHMVVHGLLHLQGYDHINTNDAEQMEAKEIEILSVLGYDNPYRAEHQKQ